MMKHPEIHVLPMIPLRDAVLFPGTVMPFLVGRDASRSALLAALSGDRKIFVATQHSAEMIDPNLDQVFSVGTICTIVESLLCEDGSYRVLLEGQERARLIDIQSSEKHLLVSVKSLIRAGDSFAGMSEKIQEVVSLAEQHSKLASNLLAERVHAQGTDDPGKLADLIASNLELNLQEKQDFLETISSSERLLQVLEIMKQEVKDLRVEKKIGKRVKRQMEQAQREYYLNEKMRAIQQELGVTEESVFEEEVERYRSKIESVLLSEDAKEKAHQELRRIRAMPSISAEATVSRNYLDWILGVPWGIRSDENEDLKLAQKILDEDHFGLEKIKERIVEFLACRKLSGRKEAATILCFVGPPGVGKTSLASSIARATGRKFVRLSLGGVRDEAEIRGHRRTYVGAFPGQIVQMMKRAGTVNPVFLLDEIDKMSMDFRGDPSAALLEVLDPEQNKAFLDHYMDTTYDLSQVMFIATANVPYKIPVPLHDRMEILRLPGYAEEEKIQIASQFLIPKELENHGLTRYNVQFPSETIRYIIRKYTRESGVRNLQREIASICRKIAKKIALGERFMRKIDTKQIQRFLGVPKFRQQDREETDEIGMATGLAWTEMGGELLFAEATLMDGKGRLILTGKLGKVMQESARAALSYIRSRTGALGVNENFHQNLDFHVHIPEGAIPKDGPSAGVTMATALISALTQKPVKRNVAMTGEITLRGKILPIGGVKEKVLAAHRAGVSTVILPKKNEKDLAEIPPGIRKELKLKLVDSMDEVLPIALSRTVRRKSRPSARRGVRRKNSRKELAQ